MKTTFYQYYQENNILDNLIKEFEKRNWQFEKMPTDYFHQFKWPDIVLSDKVSKFKLPNKNLEIEFPFAIELLGCYESDPESENCRVTLYMPKIRCVALDYASKKLGVSCLSDSDSNYFIELLTSLILVHEFTHWIIHNGQSRNLFMESSFKKLEKVEYDHMDAIEFHETAAQILTNYICSKDSDLWDLFIWLSDKQPEQYNVYRELLWKNKEFKYKVDENQLNDFIDFLASARHYDIQLYSYCKLFYETTSIVKEEKEKESKKEVDNNCNYSVYYSTLEKLKIQNVLWGEPLDVDDLEPSLSMSNYQNNLGYMILIYAQFWHVIPYNEILLSKLEEAIKNNYPIIFEVLLKTYRGSKIGVTGYNI
jgi:hypothetical protein